VRKDLLFDSVRCALERNGNVFRSDLFEQHLHALVIDLHEVFEGEHELSYPLGKRRIRFLNLVEELRLQLPVHLVKNVGDKLDSSDLFAFHAPKRLELLSQDSFYLLDYLLVHLFQVRHTHDDLTMHHVGEVGNEVARLLHTQYGQHEGDGLRMLATQDIRQYPRVRGSQKLTGHPLPRLHVPEEELRLFSTEALLNEHFELRLAADDVLFSPVDSAHEFVMHLCDNVMGNETQLGYFLPHGLYLFLFKVPD